MEVAAAVLAQHLCPFSFSCPFWKCRMMTRNHPPPSFLRRVRYIVLIIRQARCNSKRDIGDLRWRLFHNRLGLGLRLFNDTLLLLFLVLLAAAKCPEVIFLLLLLNDRFRLRFRLGLRGGFLDWLFFYRALLFLFLVLFTCCSK